MKPTPQRAEALRIALVAGEPSGDALGAALITALRQRHPGTIAFRGAGGAGMRSAGLHAVVTAEHLGVNGLVGPLLRAPQLLGALARLGRDLQAWQPHALVGIDFNVFNLRLERRLKAGGIPVAHYVSPSVYAWRRGRVRDMHRSCDLMLTLFPFEPALYAGSGVPARFVGHPLADEIPAPLPRAPARAQLGLDAAARVLTLLPGSRLSELQQMTSLFLAAAAQYRQRVGDAQVLVPAADAPTHAWLRQRLPQGDAALRLLPPGQARQAMAAADVVLVKSGTGTLEALLLERPMVVAYRLGRLTHAVLRPLVSTPWLALPNILAGEMLVPELIQDAATPAALAAALVAAPQQCQPQRLQALAAMLRPPAVAGVEPSAGHAAAAAVLQLIADRDLGGSAV